MTALNLFCQGAGAYMLTDTAATDENGRLISTRPKALLLRRARMAICWTGMAPMPNGGVNAAANAAGCRVKDALRLQGVNADDAPQGVIMAALPSALRAIHLENLAKFSGLNPDYASLAIGVAMWSQERGPMTIVGSSDGMGQLPPYTFARVAHYLAAQDGEDGETLLNRVFGRNVDLCDPEDFDAQRDGRTLIRAQRNIRVSYAKHVSIGGRAVLVRVSQRGIESTVLHRWPDQVGQLLELDRPQRCTEGRLRRFWRLATSPGKDEHGNYR